MKLTTALLVSLACLLSIALADKEKEAHGAHSPHDKRTKDKDHFHDGEHNAEYDHEAVLGSRKEAEEFEELSPEESKERLRKLAKGKMDKDGDGFVDKEEMKAWIEHNLKQLDLEEVDERFKEIDGNNDGGITFDEYKKDAFGEDAMDPEQQGNIDAEDLRLLEEDKRFFLAADVDKSGSLSKEEFAAFQNPEGFDHMLPSLIENTLKEKDKNNDGLIDLKEFLGDNADSEADWVGQEKDRFSEDYDKDGDGKLDKEEMKDWLIPNLGKTAKEESDHLFDQADDDKDGKLSIDEIVEKHETFVGSEATNYGETLEKMKHEEL